MESNCIRETSRACFNSCSKALLGLPGTHHTEHSDPTSSSADPRHEFITAIVSSLQPNARFTNHESLPSLPDLFSSLKNAYPHYLNTLLVDNIRAEEYYHLSFSKRVCLDYTGHGLFSYSQQQQQQRQITPSPEIASTSSSSNVLDAAPFFDISYKAVNLSSYLLYGGQESEFEATIRRRIMKFMNVSEEDYSLVFTANQSSSFKLLADSYPFHSNQDLLTVYDHENDAVETMVESSKRRGVRAISAVFTWPNLRVHSGKMRKAIVNKNKAKKNRGLFVFPLQSRVSGARYSYQWMSLARENGWHVLLDGCSLGAKDMETLGLSLFQPDFLICSFLKIFGENPSGFCCLLVKKSVVSELRKSSVTMGIISLVPARGGAFENLANTSFRSLSQWISQEKAIKHVGTEEEKGQSVPDDIIELDKKLDTARSRKSESVTAEVECRGLDHADRLGLIVISTRIRCLVNWLVNALMSLRHPHSGNGLPLVRIYGPKIKLDRGPAVALNVYDWKGEKVDPVLVQKLADRHNISLSCGLLTNIWFTETYAKEREKILDEATRRKGKHGFGISLLSVSIGMLTDFEDVYRLWAFVSKFLDADFVEKERWRYTGLNQTTVEV